MTCNSIRALWRDTHGAALVEFALLAPTIFALMFGVLQVGFHMFAYNAVRSVASDTARYTIVEYQKGLKLTGTAIEDKAVAYAVNAPYGLDNDNLDTTVTQPVSDIAGTTKFMLTITYVPANMLGFFHIGSPTITVTRPIYVAT
jgi:Flp pilus assembly protein TadG